MTTNTSSNLLNNPYTEREKKLIDEAYYRDLKYNLTSKSRWKFIGDVSETLSQICVGTSSVLAFASGFFEDIDILAFVAGTVGVGSLVLLQFSSYAMKESSERTQQVNVILTKLGLETIPDIVVEPSIIKARLQGEQENDVVLEV